MGILDKLKKNTTIEETALLEQSIIWEEKDIIVTDIPALNIALSGKMTGGMGPGLLQIAGPSKRFKTKFAFEIAKSFQRKFNDGAILFYDTEFGAPKPYFDDLNKDNILHTPIPNLEKLSHDISVQFDAIDSTDRVLVLLDSLGNCPSIKEATDMLAGKSTADMTRAKVIKSLFRVIGPSIGMKNIYMIAINHTYKTLELYSKDVVGGGTGTEYNSNGIWIIGAEKNKDSEKELLGFDFKIKIEKSRFVKQDKIIPITVSFDSGIDKWSGMFDLAVEMGYIIRPTAQKYALANNQQVQLKKTEIDVDQWMNELINNTDFPLAVEKEYSL